MSNIDISDDLYDYELCVGYMYMYILDLDHLLNESKKAMLCTSEHAKKGGGDGACGYICYKMQHVFLKILKWKYTRVNYDMIYEISMQRSFHVYPNILLFVISVFITIASLLWIS